MARRSGLAFPFRFATPIALWSLSGIAGVLELVGGALMIVGLFTRPAAFVLSGLMAFAYFIAHAPRASGRSSTAASWPRCTASSSSISPPRAAAPGASTLAVRDAPR